MDQRGRELWHLERRCGLNGCYSDFRLIFGHQSAAIPSRLMPVFFPVESHAAPPASAKAQISSCAISRSSYTPRPFPNPLPFQFVMSQHRSLKGASSVGSKRSVLKRGERIKLLKSRGLWKEGRLPTGLPKTKSE